MDCVKDNKPCVIDPLRESITVAIGAMFKKTGITKHYNKLCVIDA